MMEKFVWNIAEKVSKCIFITKFIVFTIQQSFYRVIFTFIRVFVNICDERFDSCQLLQIQGT